MQAAATKVISPKEGLVKSAQRLGVPAKLEHSEKGRRDRGVTVDAKLYDANLRNASVQALRCGDADSTGGRP